MTRLQLVQRLSREAGVNFEGPTTTLNQSGVYLQLVEWIDAAYEAIQNMYTTWEFLRSEFSKTLTISKGTYTPTELGVTDWGEWAIEDWYIKLTAADEVYLPYIDYAIFRQQYGVGTDATIEGKPIIFTKKPNDSILLYKIPSVAYTIRGEYFKKPLVMSTDSDATTGTPIFAANYHLAIVWRALQYYATSYAEPDKFAVGQAEYRKMINSMKKKYLPRTKWGEPLA